MSSTAHAVCCCPGAIEPLKEIAMTEFGVTHVRLTQEPDAGAQVCL